MKYSIDTSSILDCWNRWYPPDVFPDIWTNIEELFKKEIIIASEEVLFELEKKQDEPYKWAKKNSDLFIQIDDEQQTEVSRILADHKKLIDQRQNRSAADPFVIALAKVKGCAVLTGEKPTDSLKRPNIPDVCNVLNITHINILELCREQKWTFVNK